MARPDDQDQVHGIGEDDYTADLPESRQDTEDAAEAGEGEKKQSILERAKERAARAVGSFGAAIKEGVRNLPSRIADLRQESLAEYVGTEKEGGAIAESQGFDVDAESFVDVAVEAERQLEEIEAQVQGGTIQPDAARQAVLDLNTNLIGGFQKEVESPLKRLKSWLMGKETEAPVEGGDEQETGTETSIHEAKGAPLSHLGQLAQRGIDAAFGRRAPAEEERTKEEILVDAEARVAASSAAANAKYRELETAIRALLPLLSRDDSAGIQAINALLYSLGRRMKGLDVEYTIAQEVLKDKLNRKMRQKGAAGIFDVAVRTLDEGFDTFLSGIRESAQKLAPFGELPKSGPGDNEARERFLTEAEIRVQVERDALQQKQIEIDVRLGDALALGGLTDENRKGIVDLRSNVLKECGDFQTNLTNIHERLKYTLERATSTPEEAEGAFTYGIQRNVDHINGRLDLFERRLASIIRETTSTAPEPDGADGQVEGSSSETGQVPSAGEPEAPGASGAETISAPERTRLEQGVKDADVLIGAVDGVDDRFTHALTELNRLSDPTLKSVLRYQLDLSLDRLIGMRNAVRNARDTLRAVLSGGKTDRDPSLAVATINEHNAPGSDFHNRHEKFFETISRLEDVLLPQDGGATPAVEAPVASGSSGKPDAGPPTEPPADDTPAPEAPAPKPETAVIPPDIQKSLDAARFVLKHATDADDAYLKGIKESRGSANNLSEDEGRAIQHFQIACSGIRDALNNAEAILKGDTFGGDPQKLNQRAQDAYASLEKLKAIAGLANDLADAAYLLEQNLPSTIEPVLAAALDKVEQDAQEKLRTSTLEEINKTTREYKALNRRIPREFDDLVVLDKDKSEGGTTVVQALSQIYDLIETAQKKHAAGDFSDAQLTLRLVNEAWIQPLNAVIDTEIAEAQKAHAEALTPPDASGDAGKTAAPDPEAPTSGTEDGEPQAVDPIESVKASAKELVETKRSILEHNLNHLIRTSLTEEQRDWATKKYGDLGVKADKLRRAFEDLVDHSDIKVRIEENNEAMKTAALNTLSSAVDELIDAFPITQEAIIAAMDAEVNTSTTATKGPAPEAPVDDVGTDPVEPPGPGLSAAGTGGSGESAPPSEPPIEGAPVDLFKNQKQTAENLINYKVGDLQTLVHAIDLKRLSPEQNDWFDARNRQFAQDVDLLQSWYEASLIPGKTDIERGKALADLGVGVDKLIADFPKTAEEIVAAMEAEKASATAPAPEGAAVTPEDPLISAEKSKLTGRLETYRQGLESGYALLEVRLTVRPELRERGERFKAQLARDVKNLMSDIDGVKTPEEADKMSERIGEAYGNLIDALSNLADLVGAYQGSVEAQKKTADLEMEKTSDAARIALLEEQVRILNAALAAGGVPPTPGAGPGAPDGSAPSGGPGGGAPPPPSDGPPGPGGTTPPEPPPAPESGEPGDPERIQAEVLKAEIETLIPEIDTALADRDYLRDVNVFLPIKRPENPGAINAIEMPVGRHIDFVNGAPAKIDQKITGNTLEARQFAEDAKVHAEAIIKWLQEPLSPEAEERAIEALRQRFIRTAAGYQRNIETANVDLFPRTRDLMHPLGIDTAPLRELFQTTGETFNTIEDLLRASPPDVTAIAEAYNRFQGEVQEVAQEVARLQQEVADAALGARAGRAAGAVRDAYVNAAGTTGRAVIQAGPRAGRAIGRADRNWERRIDRNLERSGRADSFEDRARRFFHGIGQRFGRTLADRVGMGYNSALLAIHERGVEDIGARVDMNRDDIASLREEVTDLNRRLGPTNPDELTPGEIAAERRDWNRVTREINRLQGQLNRDLGTLETRQARAKPYFDRRKEIAADAKNQLERDLGGRFARYENAKERSAGIDRELKNWEGDRDSLRAEIQALRFKAQSERPVKRRQTQREIRGMEHQIREIERDINTRRQTLRGLGNDIESLAPHVTYWRDQVIPELTSVTREIPVNHGQWGAREAVNLNTDRAPALGRNTPTPDTFPRAPGMGGPAAGGGGGGGSPEAPAVTPEADARPAGVETNDENIRITPRDVADALFRKWGSQIGVANREAMVGAMNQFVTENPTRFAGTLEQDFRLSELPDFVRALNTYLDNHDFNHVDLRTIRTLTRDLRTAKEPRAA
ncbi:MAG: hypothetical protein AAB416_03260 [Patescibacteria group bacterium]